MTASQVKDSLLVPSEQTGAAGNNAQIVGPYCTHCTHCRVNSNNKQIKYVVKTVVKTGRVSKINNPK